jgi:hypothetical protein
MSDAPKLLGDYSTPAFDYGDVVICDRRGGREPRTKGRAPSTRVSGLAVRGRLAARAAVG